MDHTHEYKTQKGITEVQETTLLHFHRLLKIALTKLALIDTIRTMDELFCESDDYFGCFEVSETVDAMDQFSFCQPRFID
ncbi:hypothetical protein KIN20_036532 [Parelaphostrongylus tenuis]|uniref:Uncharacterized protein n=1 Tax=Parelaphostrongylus tenuis TaxID=148309 RepID=A0AAD5RCS3_PARTN|nr:hypothetical protein KIN20_036532 [Parelaphostrongylus tenuis]